MLADGQRAEAIRLFDLSSQLYGPSTPRGQTSAEKAKILKGSMESATAPGANRAFQGCPGSRACRLSNASGPSCSVAGWNPTGR